MTRIPFSVDELKVIGMIPRAMPQGLDFDKLNTPIPARENYLAFLRNETPCWMPNGDCMAFCPAMLPENIARGMVIEATPCDKRGGKDMFGVEWVYDEASEGSMVMPGSPCLPDTNMWKERVTFPDIDSWDWEGCAERNREFLADTDIPIFMTHYTGLFERLIALMDFENAAIALIDEDQKEATKELLHAICDLHMRILDYEIKYFNITGILFHDDWGSQRSPFFSLETFREMILPCVQKLTAYCHSKNIVFELHSCGHTELLAEGIAETGIDMWRPQPMNDTDRLYREYGDKFKLGIRQPMFGPNATDEDKINAARALVARYNTPGKYVYTMSHFQDPLFRKVLYAESRLTYNKH